MMMIKWPNGWKEILAWALGGGCILILCLAATFPYETLHKRLVAELNQATGMDVRVGEWAVGLPLGIEWRNVTLSKKDWSPIHLASLRAKVGIVQALAGGLGLDVVVQLDETSSNGGLARGVLTASSFSLAESVTAAGQFQQVDLSKIVRPYVGHGILNGDFSLRVEPVQTASGMRRGEGTWKAEAKDVAVDHIPLGNGRRLSLAFSLVSAELACRDFVCKVTRLRGEGIDGSFTGDGEITVQQPMQNSGLALTLTLLPGGGFASKAGELGLPFPPPGTPITVKIAGTLAQAKIAL
jgi:type II secretion system protein N